MNKQTKMLVGVGAVAVAGYFIWKSTQKKSFSNLTPNALVKKNKKSPRISSGNPRIGSGGPRIGSGGPRGTIFSSGNPRIGSGGPRIGSGGPRGTIFANEPIEIPIKGSYGGSYGMV